LTNFGVGGGSITVNGAGQTGNSINVSGGPASEANWLRQGDIIQFAGDSLVYDVNGLVGTDGGGDAALLIHPPKFTGNSPANNEAVEIVASAIFMKVVLTNVDMPDIDADGVMPPGLTLEWREQPTI
jgi:hypothetical protein